MALSNIISKANNYIQSYAQKAQNYISDYGWGSGNTWNYSSGGGSSSSSPSIKSGLQSSGGSSYSSGKSYSGKSIGDLLLPTAEVTVNTNPDTSSDGWFYADTNAGSKNSGNDGWNYASSGGGYYGGSANNEPSQSSYNGEYSSPSPSVKSGLKSTQQTPAPQQNLPEAIVEPVSNSTPTVSQQTANLRNSLLSQSAAEDNSVMKQKSPLPGLDTIFDENAIQRDIRRIMNDEVPNPDLSRSRGSIGRDKAYYNWAWKQNPNPYDRPTFLEKVNSYKRAMEFEGPGYSLPNNNNLQYSNGQEHLNPSISEFDDQQALSDLILNREPEEMLFPDGTPPKPFTPNIGPAEIIGRTFDKAVEPLQDSQAVQNLTGGKSLVELIGKPLVDIADRAYVNNPVNWPFRALGITPSQLFSTAQQSFDNNAIPLINRGFEKANNIVNSALDTATTVIPATARTGLNIANEAAVKPLLDSYLSSVVPGYKSTTSLDSIISNVQNEAQKYRDKMSSIFSGGQSSSQNTGNNQNQNNQSQNQNRSTGRLSTMVDLKNNVTNYDQLYNDYFSSHYGDLYNRYKELGYDDQRAMNTARDTAQRMAYQHIYDLGYRANENTPAAYIVPSLQEHIAAMEKATGNNYYTNKASFDDRYLNMVMGGIEGHDDRLFDEITSELAGNAYANQTRGTNYGTTPKITDLNNPDNQASWNTALQAAMSGSLTKDQILHLYDSQYSDLVIPEETKKWLASDSTHSLQQMFLNMGKNGGRLEIAEGTPEEYRKAYEAFINANPALKLMRDNGVLSDDDIQMNFFKGANFEESDDDKNNKAYGRSGGYGRSSSSRGGGGGGGGGSSYGSGGSGSGSSTKTQSTSRIHNIMKNWTF